jgi:hypothetical protein
VRDAADRIRVPIIGAEAKDKLPQEAADMGRAISELVSVVIRGLRIEGISEANLCVDLNLSCWLLLLEAALRLPFQR